MIPAPPSPDDVLDLLARLVDKSLVLVEEHGPAARYRLLEPVRQYAEQQLVACGEAAAARGRHAAYYLGLAERVAPELRGPAPVAWLGRLDHERDNLRSALRRLEERGDAVAGARLAVALVPFWEVRGYLSEGRRWLDGVLAAARAGSLPGALRTQALLGAGRLAFWQVDLEAAARCAESLALARELGDRPAVAAALAWLGATHGGRGAFAAAEQALSESLALHEALGDESGAAWALFTLGRATANRGVATGDRGELARAVPLLEASVRRYRALGDVRFGGIACTLLGAVVLRFGERERTAGLLREGLAGLQAVGDRAYLFPSLLTLALVAAMTEQPVRAARLLGAAEAVGHALGSTLPTVSRVTEEEVLGAIRPHLDPPALAAARAAGRAMTPGEVMAEAWAPAHVVTPPRRRAAAPPAATSPEPLTPREQEVARLLAGGQTDRQIAAALGIAVSTASVHVRHLLAKLDLRSRW